MGQYEKITVILPKACIQIRTKFWCIIIDNLEMLECVPIQSCICIVKYNILISNISYFVPVRPYFLPLYPRHRQTCWIRTVNFYHSAFWRCHSASDAHYMGIMEIQRYHIQSVLLFSLIIETLQFLTGVYGWVYWLHQKYSQT